MTDNESDTPNRQLQQTSLSARRLKSFPSPDLEVLVGPKQRVYRYHALILAGHSQYVDMILSSPMGAKNQEQMRIEFPDIPEETWEKMISWLEPSGRFQKYSLVDIEEVLPFFDKYQFADGIQICDSLLPQIFKPESFYDKYGPNKLANLAVMAFELNLPTSKSIAVSWACEVLKTMSVKNEETIRKLLPIVENEDEVLVALVKTMKGRHYVHMEIDEMRQMTRADTFPSDVILRTEQISEIGDIMRKLTVDKVTISIDEGTVGIFERDGRNFYTDTCAGAALAYRYKDGHSGNVIEAMDPFGIQWEIVALSTSASDGDDENDTEDDSKPGRRVLYRWDGGYSSLFVPKHGWKTVEAESQISGVSYFMESSRY